MSFNLVMTLILTYVRVVTKLAVHVQVQDLFLQIVQDAPQDMSIQEIAYAHHAMVLVQSVQELIIINAPNASLEHSCTRINVCSSAQTNSILLNLNLNVFPVSVLA